MTNDKSVWKVKGESQRRARRRYNIDVLRDDTGKGRINNKTRFKKKY